MKGKALTTQVGGPELGPCWKLDSAVSLANPSALMPGIGECPVPRPTVNGSYLVRRKHSEGRTYTEPSSGLTDVWQHTTRAIPQY